jgi:hypothetical protein
MYGTASNNHRPKGDTASAARLKNTKKGRQLSRASSLRKHKIKT